MKKKFLFYALFSSLFICSCNISGHSSHDTSPATYDAFLEKMFCQEIAENTINLHFTLAHPGKAGIMDYEVTLGDLSPSAIAESNARMENYLEALHQFSDTELSVDRRLTRDILINAFELQLQMAPLGLYDEPLSPSGGVHAQLPLLFEEYAFYYDG